MQVITKGEPQVIECAHDSAIVLMIQLCS